MSRGGLEWQPSEFEVSATTRADGSILLRPTAKLPRCPDRLTDRLEYWSERAPDRVLVGQRDACGDAFLQDRRRFDLPDIGR